MKGKLAISVALVPILMVSGWLLVRIYYLYLKIIILENTSHKHYASTLIYRTKLLSVLAVITLGFFPWVTSS